MADTPGAPMWMVTFADLMALLLTLFVLLLTFSEMDVIRFKSIVGSLKSASGFSKTDFAEGVVEEDGSIIGKSLSQASPDAPRVTQSLPPPSAPKVESQEGMTQEEAAEKVSEALEQMLGNLQGAEEVDVQHDGGNVLVRFPNRIAFPSGSSQLNEAFAAILNRIKSILDQVENANFAIAGHTDNVPLRSTTVFPSNWELSAARATSVVRWLTDTQGMDPTLFTVQGYGDSRPVADNESEEGRGQNRRVELVVVINPESQGEGDGGDGGGSSLPAADEPAAPATFSPPAQ
jgi:chemotaxis protein MotB